MTSGRPSLGRKKEKEKKKALRDFFFFLFGFPVVTYPSSPAFLPNFFLFSLQKEKENQGTASHHERASVCLFCKVGAATASDCARFFIPLTSNVE